MAVSFQSARMRTRSHSRITTVSLKMKCCEEGDLLLAKIVDNDLSYSVAAVVSARRRGSRSGSLFLPLIAEF